MIAGLKAGLANFRRAQHDRQLKQVRGSVDALLVSYPKSGRTWLRYLLSIYFAQVFDLGLAPDLRTTFQVVPNYDLDATRGLAAAEGIVQHDCQLVAASHRDWDPDLFAGKPTIFLIRDPRDVLVSSYFHQTRHKHRFDGELPDFIDDADYGVGSIGAFHNRWLDGLRGQRHIVISYEELSADTDSTVRRVLGFLDVPIDEPALEHAIRQARFDKMRKKEKSEGIPGHSYDRSDADASRVRRGKVSGYLDYLGPRELERIDAILDRVLSDPARRAYATSGYRIARSSAAA